MAADETVDKSGSCEAEWFYARLPEFLNGLQDEGMIVEPVQHRHVVRILADLALGDGPLSLDQVARMICPILAGTPDQQRICHRRFADVFDIGAPSEHQNGPGPEKHDQVDDRLEHRERLQPWLLSGIAVCATILFMIAAYLLVGTFYNPMPVREEASTTSDRPIPEFGGDIPAWIQEYPIKELEPPKQSPWNRTKRWYYTEYDWKKWLAAVSPWLLYIAAMAAMINLTLAHLRRDNLRENFRDRRLHFAGESPRLGDRTITAALQPLRTYARRYIRRLDTGATVRATVANGGLLMLVHRDEPVPAHFVAFVDRRSVNDHLAAYADTVLSAMTSAGLAIERFEFHRDPRLCRRGRNGEMTSLKAVADIHSDSVFLVFLAEEDLVNPGTFEPAAWLADLTAVQQRYLFLPHAEILPRDGALARSTGFEVVEMAPAGLRRLVEFLVGQFNSLPMGGQSGRNIVRGQALDRLVDHIGARADRWTQSSALARRDIDDVMQDLDDALGTEGFRWVAATAVYPELRWQMTAHLKRALADGGHNARTLDGVLLAVSRLPWFRRGWMPSWLRDAFVRRLSRGRRGDVHDRILSAMGLPAANRPASDMLEIALKKDREANKSQLRRRADRVFLDFLLPRLKQSSNLFSVPEKWAGRIARKPILRLVAAGIVGAGLAGSGSVAALSLIDIHECDLLGASLWDPERIGPGRYLSDVRRAGLAEKLLRDCQQAVSKYPENLRFRQQLLRVKSDFLVSENITGAEIIRKYKILANKKHPMAVASLAVFYAQGVHVERDLHYGIKLSNEAIKLGVVGLIPTISDEIRLSKDPSLDTKETFLSYQAMAEELGSTYLGLFFYVYNGGAEFSDGQKIESNHSEYIRLVKLGVERGDSFSADHLGSLYERGKFGDPNYQRASQFYHLAIEQGAGAFAAWRIAVMIRKGQLGPIDQERAAYLAIFAAKGGEGRAVALIEEMLFDGTLEAQTTHKIRVAAFIARWREAAEAGDMRAQFYLGRYLEEREGKVEQAKGWYQKAAAQGYEKADKELKRLADE